MNSNKVLLSIAGTLMFIFIVAGLMWGIPQYKVWQQELSGKAKLMKMEQEKKIQISQAKAELEAANFRAQAIEVMGEAAKKYPEYRLQEFMGAFAEALQNGSIEKIIFVPTEANIPITEASRTVEKK